MSSAQQPSQQRIIIHHLSDLHYEDTSEGKKKNILVKYKGYLENLPEDRRPHVIIITGDMTTSGTAQDLKTVATILRNWFPGWENRLNEHIFIVPGPRDVNWEGKNSPGLTEFFESFSEFALPSPEGAPPAASTPSKGTKNFIVYAIDTCYSPDDLQTQLKSEFTEYATRFEAFGTQRDNLAKPKKGGLWGWCERLRKGEDARAKELESLHTQFLQLTEGAPPASLDTGRVTPNDITRFEQWTKTSTPAQPDSQTPQDPLKILITHHPLAIQPEQSDAKDASQNALLSFQKVALAARSAGFHLALHGHIHKPQVLSDLSILEGLDVQHPMRQIGAASLGDTALFNEITAQYRVEQGKGIWRLELRLVNVVTDTADRGSGSSFVLLNPAETADNKVDQLTRTLERREKFAHRLRIGMRRYSELVYQMQNETRPEKLSGFTLPQDTMQFIEGIIRDVIFAEYQVRVQLLLKSVETYRPLPKLIPTYLTPAILEGPGTLVYPASVAAWSLVLGRTLIYPDILKEGTGEEDLDWLRRTDKIAGLRKALELLNQDAFEKSFPGSDALQRYEKLQTRLATISNNGNTPITGEEMYQKVPTGDSLNSYPSFICVPYPMRPPGGDPPTLPEIAVLDIGVREVAPSASWSQPMIPIEPPFSDERIDMLKSLTEFIGLVLTTSSALGKPRGIWDDRTKV